MLSGVGHTCCTPRRPTSQPRRQSARPRRRPGQSSAASQAATGRISGVSQDPHVLDTAFLGALRMERPFGIPLRRPVTTATRPPRSFSSRRLKVPTYPHIHRSGHPPPPLPHPPFPPPALSGYLDEASASFRVDFSMRHLGPRIHGATATPAAWPDNGDIQGAHVMFRRGVLGGLLNLRLVRTGRRAADRRRAAAAGGAAGRYRIPDHRLPGSVP